MDTLDQLRASVCICEVLNLFSFNKHKCKYVICTGLKSEFLPSKLLKIAEHRLYFICTPAVITTALILPVPVGEY